MKILVKPKWSVERSCPWTEPHIIISIFTPGDSPPCVKTNDFTKEVLQLSFYDLSTSTNKYPVIFTRDHALLIKRFVYAHNDVNKIIVHCDVGISRSAGVAAALKKRFDGDDSLYFKRYCPNMLIYRTLLDVLQEE